MSFQQIINYTPAENFSFDSSLIEISGGAARLKDQRPSTATFYAALTAALNATWSSGSPIATAVGGAAISGGRLDCTGGSKYVTYLLTANFPDPAPTVTVRFKYRPAYSGPPSTNRGLFLIGDAGFAGGGVISMSHEDHSGLGLLRLQTTDNLGSFINNGHFGPWSPTAGQEYEFELNTDAATGAHRLFIDGVQYGSTLTGTGTRGPFNSGGVGKIYIGRDYADQTADAHFTNFIIYSSIQHTSGYTPGATIPPALYVTSAPAIVANSGIMTDGLLGFEESVTTPSGTTIKYQLRHDSVNYWHTGSAWAVSDGTAAQSNTAAQIHANRATFDIDDGVTLFIRALLISDDGSARPILTSNTVDYDFFITEPSAPDECIVYVWLKDLEGATISEDATFSAQLRESFFAGSHLIAAGKKTVNFSSEGYAELSLVCSETEEKEYQFSVVYQDQQGRTKTIRGTAVVPNETDIPLADVIEI